MLTYGTDYGPAYHINKVIEELDLLRGFIHGLESQIQDWPKKVALADIEVIADEFCYQENKHIYGLDDSTWHFDTIFLEFFPNIQRCSTFVSLCSFMEYELNDLCVKFEKTENLKLRINEITRNGGWTQRFETYLSKVVGIENPFIDISWQNIKICQELRNNVVHNNRKLRENKKNIENYIKNSPHINLTENTEIQLKDSFLLYLLDQCENFLKILLSDIANFHKLKSQN